MVVAEETPAKSKSNDTKEDCGTARKESKKNKKKRKSRESAGDATASDSVRTTATPTSSAPISEPKTSTKKKKQKKKKKKQETAGEIVADEGNDVADHAPADDDMMKDENDDDSDGGALLSGRSEKCSSKAAKRRKQTNDGEDKKKSRPAFESDGIEAEDDAEENDDRMDDDENVVKAKAGDVAKGTRESPTVDARSDDSAALNDSENEDGAAKDSENEPNGDDEDNDGGGSDDDGDEEKDDDDNGSGERMGKGQVRNSTGFASDAATVLPPLELVSPAGHAASSPNQKVVVLLDQASLETVKNRKGNFELLNCDDHRDLCRFKLKKDPKNYRPDICHQELLALIDSPLNRAGRLQVYVKTTRNVLIHVHPSVRIPRTYKRFSGLMVQLLHKLKIKSSTGGGPEGSSSTTLLKVVKNPFSQYLPAGTRVFGMSCKGRLYSPIALASSALPGPLETNASPPIAFVVGAMATGSITQDDHPYIEEMVSISEYPLSGAAAIARLLGAVEHHWGIV